MGNHKATIIIGVLLGIALLAVAAFWLYAFERVEEKVKQPPAKEFAKNPFYLLQKILEKDGIHVNVRNSESVNVNGFGREDTLLLYGNTKNIDPVQSTRIAEWVARGGHLIVGYPYLDVQSSATDFFLDTLDIERSVNSECVAAVIPESQRPKKNQDAKKAANQFDYENYFCASTSYSSELMPVIAGMQSEEKGKYLYARFQKGNGTIDITNDLDFMTNNPIVLPINTELSKKMLAPGYAKGNVHIFYSFDREPLGKLLMQYGWMFFIPLMIAVGLWLWMRAQRIGSVVPSEEEDRRSLVEHISANGEYLLRYQQLAVLHNAVLTNFMKKLQRRDPLTASLPAHEQALELAKRTGFDAQDIESALTSKHDTDIQTFRRDTAHLLQLRKYL